VLRFNDLLTIEGIDPQDVQLARHHVTNRKPSIYSIWRSPERREIFEEYQRLQGKARFDVGKILASFVVTPPPRNETTFIGLFRVMAASEKLLNLRDPIYGTVFDGWQYDILREDQLSDYAGRLIVQWGRGALSWVQRAANQNKPILAIRDQDDEGPPFPGFDRFSMNLEDIPGIYRGWAEVLRSVKGIYLLVDRNSGERYIGSAKGEQSLLGRFMDYAATSHGGDVELKLRLECARQASAPDPLYQVSVLQIVDIGQSVENIEQIEALWKTRLLTRHPFGLNRN